jgi:mannose-6-phosphate isomerase
MRVEKKLYKINPVFNYRVWGGNALKELYGYESDLENIGECYNVIAMKDHLDCTVDELDIKLSVFYDENRWLFNSDTDDMPVRTAMANPIAPMSVQLHPSDEYALKHEGKKGKPDGVYFIKGEGTMVLGHHAQTKEEFIDMVHTKQWDKLIRKVRVKEGDFVDVPYGTLHAFGAGFVLIEFTQNADLTYRLYDYDRIDPKLNGLRELHIQQVFDNVRIPNDDPQPVDLIEEVSADNTHICFHHEPGVYTAGLYNIQKEGSIKRNEFYFLTCISGEGKLNDVSIKGGETVFVPCDFQELKVSGSMELAYVTYIKKEEINY